MIFYEIILLRGPASVLVIRSVVACSDCLRERGPIEIVLYIYKPSLNTTRGTPGYYSLLSTSNSFVASKYAP